MHLTYLTLHSRNCLQRFCVVKSNYATINAHMRRPNIDHFTHSRPFSPFRLGRRRRMAWRAALLTKSVSMSDSCMCFFRSNLIFNVHIWYLAFFLAAASPHEGNLEMAEFIFEPVRSLWYDISVRSCTEMSANRSATRENWMERKLKRAELYRIVMQIRRLIINHHRVVSIES